MMSMKSQVRNIILCFILCLVSMMLLPGCATAKKDTYLKDKARAQQQQHISTTQLGHNRYFFSKKYQKKLARYKKK